MCCTLTSCGFPVRKTPLFAPFMYKNDQLPRQARDKNRETQKRVAFFAGITAQNYLPCILQGVTPGVDDVARVLAANSLAAFHASNVAAARKATLDGLRKDKIFIGRVDVQTQHLDGTKRTMGNENELATALQGLVRTRRF